MLGFCSWASGWTPRLACERNGPSRWMPRGCACNGCGSASIAFASDSSARRVESTEAVTVVGKYCATPCRARKCWISRSSAGEADIRSYPTAPCVWMSKKALVSVSSSRASAVGSELMSVNVPSSPTMSTGNSTEPMSVSSRRAVMIVGINLLVRLRSGRLRGRRGRSRGCGCCLRRRRWGRGNLQIGRGGQCVRIRPLPLRAAHLVHASEPCVDGVVVVRKHRPQSVGAVGAQPQLRVQITDERVAVLEVLDAAVYAVDVAELAADLSALFAVIGDRVGLCARIARSHLVSKLELLTNEVKATCAEFERIDCVRLTQ